MKIEIKLGKQYQAFQGQPEKVVRSFLSLSNEHLTRDIKDETPVDHGKLRNSWRPRQTREKLTVSNSREYAYFVEKGTGIFGSRHKRIFTKDAQAMHATINGEDVFFTNQRGRPASHMAEKGFMKYRKRIPTLFKRSIYLNNNTK